MKKNKSCAIISGGEFSPINGIENADYIIDMGPRGGVAGGRIVAEGMPEDIKNSPESITGKYL